MSCSEDLRAKPQQPLGFCSRTWKVGLEEFVAGRVKVIANVSMLTEGFDQPDVQTIFARDASRLPTIQMCGRGLRAWGWSWDE